MKLSDLTLIQILGAILVINGALAGGVNELTDLLGPVMAKHVLSVCVIGSGICGGFITMFGGMGSQVKNVMAMPGVEKMTVNANAGPTLAAAAIDPLQDKIAPTSASLDKVTAIAKSASVILLAIVLSGMFPGDASAQAKFKPPQVTGNIIADTKANLGLDQKPVTTTGNQAFDGAFGKLSAKFNEITKQLVDAAIVDLQAALDDATKRNDQISMPCWQAHLDFAKLLPVEWENPPQVIGIALGIQIQRDLLNAITGTDKGTIKVACAALYGDELAMIAKLGLLFGIPIGV